MDASNRRKLRTLWIPTLTWREQAADHGHLFSVVRAWVHDGTGECVKGQGAGLGQSRAGAVLSLQHQEVCSGSNSTRVTIHCHSGWGCPHGCAPCLWQDGKGAGLPTMTALLHLLPQIMGKWIASWILCHLYRIQMRNGRTRDSILLYGNIV